MTELATYQPQTALTEQMDYARAVSAGSLLPREYQNNPANVLIAIGLGQSMGLSPAESLYRITVIQGKPTASAELIAANVRKAGHRLRVQGDDRTCTATIIRADDPDFEFTVTRDVAWAQSMQLHTKDNYKKQPGTMLQWRAITAVARLACPEALYGVAYTPDEIDRDDAPAAKPRGMDALRAVVQPMPEPEPVADVTDAEVVEDEPAEVVEEDPTLTKRQQGKMFALFAQKGIPEDEQRSGIEAIIGHPIAHRTSLTGSEFDAVIARLETLPDVDAAS